MPDKYQPDWENLKEYPVPEWFKDAKFGIYAHWGAYAVPAFGYEWYPKHMYDKTTDMYKHHVKHYGGPAKFGYKDFIPMFKGERFDADEWAELYKLSGAAFAGPVAQHHDGLAMWDSAVTQWNTVKMGPKRDITGELARAIRQRGLKFITSFHHAYNWRYYEPSYGYDCDTADPKNAGLYSRRHEPGAPESKEFLEIWLAKLKEVIDKYQPDQIWFDFGIERETFDLPKRKFMAYYYNKSLEWGKEVVVTHKRNMPEGVGVIDIERSREDKLTPYLWQTDDAVAWDTWSHTNGMQLKALTQLIHDLIDIVSKNGILLLNVGPRADGLITEGQRELLLGMGQWLKVNGEAIYSTRPWKVFKEDDIRFTSSKDGRTVYAICLEWPGQELKIKSITQDVSVVQMLDVKEKLKWSGDKTGLKVKTPDRKSGQHAFVFKITLAN